MKKPNLLVKLAAIACSVVLIAAFVAYRAGAFNRSKPADTQSVEPAAASSDNSTPTLTIMSGTKASFPASDIPSVEKVFPSKDGTPFIMGSTKSLAPLLPPSSGKPAAPAPAESQQSTPPQK
jgi:hypothetical protein